MAETCIGQRVTFPRPGTSAELPGGCGKPVCPLHAPPEFQHYVKERPTRRHFVLKELPLADGLAALELLGDRIGVASADDPRHWGERGGKAGGDQRERDDADQ